MKVIKRLLIALVVFVVLIFGFLLAAPLLFKDQIVANVKSSVNGALDADVDFTDVSVSFLGSFPKIAVSVDDLSVVGIDTFAGLPLLTAEEATVDLGFWSVLAGDGAYQIDAVGLNRPLVNLLVISPELANYLVVPDSDPAPNEPSTAPASPQINLQHFEINDGTFVYDDRTTGTYLKIEGLDTEGDGDFTTTVFDLKTYSKADALTFKQGGVAYLNEVKTVADATVNIDLDKSLYTFLENKISLNALELVFGGNIGLEDNGDILFDLDYSAPANNFRQLWSLIPSAYTAGYEQVRAGGTFTLNGTVDGVYNETTYPAFTVNTEISGGSVQYPGRPVGITGIDAKVDVISPGSDLNRMTVDIPRFDFDLGGDPFRGRLRLATLLNDPQVDGKIDGRVDLGKWSQALPLDGVRELAGVLSADLVFDGIRQSLVESGRYDNLRLGGELSLTGFRYVTDELPPVTIADLQADVNPRSVTVDKFDGKLGRSDLRASGTLNNPLAFFSPEQTMRGDFTVRSDFFDADEWMPQQEASAAASPAELNTAGATTGEAAVFDRFDFNVDAQIGALNYAGYRPENLKAIGNVKPNRMEIAAASGELGDSDFAGSGTVTNLFDYTFGEGVLGGDLSLRSNSLNLNDFMDEEVAVAPGATPEAEAASAVIPVPKNINLNVDVLADEVVYTDVTLKDLAGALVVTGGQAVIEDGSARLLGGRMTFAGAYDTREPGDPGFRFHYDLQSLDFTQTFKVLNSFSALAPLGKFLDGNFSTDLVMEGKLGADLFPKLSTIDAKGLFQTAEARLNRFKPAEKIGEAFNIKELKESVTLRNLTTVFKINDGRVSIEPFDVRLAGIPLTVQGQHGLDQDMDYRIRAAIPRSMIEGNIVTGTALSALDRLAGQAGRLGLNITPGDTINVAINLGGSIANPTTKFNLLGTSGDGDGSVGGALVDNARDRVNERIDQEKEKVKGEVNDRVAAAKDQAQARVDSLRQEAGARARIAQDSIRRAVAGQTERLKQQATDRLKGRLDSIRLDSLKNVLPPGVENAADKLKDELGKFNPFKKKKGGE